MWNELLFLTSTPRAQGLDSNALGRNESDNRLILELTLN